MLKKQLVRYGCVDDGIRPREVVLLRSLPCSWGHCTFCDYCDDNVNNVYAATIGSRTVLKNITGKHGVLQVIDSASWAELPFEVMIRLLKVCIAKKIHTIIFEGHWMFVSAINVTNQLFAKFGIAVEYIIGLETIDPCRRAILNKGIPKERTLEQIKDVGFNWCNLLYGDSTSPAISAFFDEVKKVSEMFDYVNISIFTDNPTATKNQIFRRPDLVEDFYNLLLPEIKKLGNVFVFDFEDSRAPDHLGGVGNLI